MWRSEHHFFTDGDLPQPLTFAAAVVDVLSAAWWWSWSPTDWDRLVGAVTAGHVIECEAQTTDGNFAYRPAARRGSDPAYG